MSDSISAFTPEALAVLRRHNLLLSLIQAVVVEDEITEVAVLPEERDQLIARWQGQMSEEEAAAVARDKLGWSPEDLEWQLLRPARVAKLARERFEAKAEARFLQRKDSLDQVVYSLVRTKDGSLARELYLRLAAGEASFAQLAASYSDGPERLSQGVIGPKPLSDAHPQLAERLRTARDGEVMEPFAVADWWLVTRRDQLLAAQFDGAMAERMTQELFQEWVQSEAQTRLAALNIQP